MTMNTEEALIVDAVSKSAQATIESFCEDVGIKPELFDKVVMHIGKHEATRDHHPNVPAEVKAAACYGSGLMAGFYLARSVDERRG